MRHKMLAGESFRADTWRITWPLRIRSRHALISPPIESVELPSKVKVTLVTAGLKKVGDIREIRIRKFFKS
jgi:hypothetical protein